MNHADTVVLNIDDPLLAAKAKRGRNLKFLTYALDHKADLRARRVGAVKGCCLRFDVRGKSVELNSLGRNNAYNALAALACGGLLKVPISKMIQALKTFRFPPGRQEISRLGRGWLINDSYNANPVSMAASIEALSALSVKGKKILVAGDMLELGPKAALYHRAIGKTAARQGVDVIITVGALARHMGNHFSRGRFFSYDNIVPAQKKLKEIFCDGDAVLVKGSRRMNMETVVEYLKS